MIGLIKLFWRGMFLFTHDSICNDLPSVGFWKWTLKDGELYLHLYGFLSNILIPKITQLSVN